MARVTIADLKEEIGQLKKKIGTLEREKADLGARLSDTEGKLEQGLQDLDLAHKGEHVLLLTMRTIANSSRFTSRSRLVSTAKAALKGFAPPS